MNFSKKNAKKQNLVIEVFQPNSLGYSKWVERETWEETDLNYGKNGNARGGIYFNDKRFIWKVQRGKQQKVIKLRTFGYSDNILYGASRPIRKDIDEFHKRKGACVVCGKKSSLVTDHKNDLYNDPRVLSVKTQTIDDFQCLCNSCNLQKRQVSKETKKNKKRYGATNIPSLELYGIDFIEGDESFDEKNINAMVGTYWYDPVAFIKFAFIKSNQN
jgi:5-methylcytosine-specific restriction endonuclease McrA